eukprot:m.44074 g.44074  ORF g.44074 m.44074 type:complete len:307 (+) comp5812_c0_seq1:493-1413(+)
MRQRFSRFVQWIHLFTSDFFRHLSWCRRAPPARTAHHSPRYQARKRAPGRIQRLFQALRFWKLHNQVHLAWHRHPSCPSGGGAGKVHHTAVSRPRNGRSLLQPPHHDQGRHVGHGLPAVQAVFLRGRLWRQLALHHQREIPHTRRARLLDRAHRSYSWPVGRQSRPAARHFCCYFDCFSSARPRVPATHHCCPTSPCPRQGAAPDPPVRVRNRCAPRALARHPAPRGQLRVYAERGPQSLSGCGVAGRAPCEDTEPSVVRSVQAAAQRDRHAHGRLRPLRPARRSARAGPRCRAGRVRSLWRQGPE